MKNKILSALALMALTVLFACGSTSQTYSMKPVVRAAVDAPERFEAPEGRTLGGNTCMSPLTDARDGTKILMQYSFTEGVADYQVPTGKYGVEKGELLRVNCATGEVVGIVRR